MIIDFKEKEIEFKIVMNGFCFKRGSEIFMKVDMGHAVESGEIEMSHDAEGFAVNLKTGDVVGFGEHCVVTPVEARVVCYGKNNE